MNNFFDIEREGWLEGMGGQTGVHQSVACRRAAHGMSDPMHRVKPETIKHQSSIAFLELQN
jgi:hypothetical protein